MNRSFKDFEHLVRLAAIFVVGILVFAVARAEFVPKDFGRDGHYRPGAIDDVRARPIAYAGRNTCTECHADVIETAAPSKHKRLPCETCHGPSARHVADQEVAPPKLDPNFCIRCHAANTGKPTGHPTVDLKDHSEPTDTCATCHKPHDPRPPE
jgi:hypothetical protein